MAASHPQRYKEIDMIALSKNVEVGEECQRENISFWSWGKTGFLEGGKWCSLHPCPPGSDNR